MEKLLLMNAEQAFELLDEHAGLYADNGGDPDGNCWLPSDQDDIPTNVAQKVIDAGYGHMVEVRMMTDEEMFAYWGYQPEQADEEMDEDDFAFLQKMANENLHWAHYGAYGAGDSHWVFIKPEER